MALGAVRRQCHMADLVVVHPVVALLLDLRGSSLAHK